MPTEILKQTVDLDLQHIDIHDTKRPCEDCAEGEPSSKRKRVAFAESSALRVCEVEALEYDDVAGSPENESSAADEANISVEASSPSDCSVQRLNLTLDNATDTQTKTKTQDGPSSATLVTNALIHTLIRNRSATRTQVADMVREAAAAIPTPPTRPTPPPTDPQSPTDADPRPVSPACPRPAPSLAPLCLAVLDRLRALSDGIEARGRASMLPCTTKLHRSILPGLRFLMSAVAAAACVAAGEERGPMEGG